MQRETAKLLVDMQRAAERIERFVQGETFEQYVLDELVRSAVERQFEILGEAMTRLLKRDPVTAEKISDCRKISGFRNALVHGYDSIDDETTWGVITQKLPNLRNELQHLLSG